MYFIVLILNFQIPLQIGCERWLLVVVTMTITITTIVTLHDEQGLGGIGAFFRVGFWGALPAELKGLEFVYRVPLMTHVSDFQNRVLQLINPLVSDPAKVSFC